MQSYLAAAFLAGVGTGFAVAAPIGPMGMICVQRTLTSGVATGLATGLGAATVHVAYSVIAVVGIATLAQPWISAHALGLDLLTGIILVSLAVRTLRANIAPESVPRSDRIRLTRAYLSAVAIGVSNPFTLVLFFAASRALADRTSSSLLVVGVFAGSTIWWIILSGIVAIARERLDPKMLSSAGRVTSLVVAAFGAFTLVRAIGGIVG